MVSAMDGKIPIREDMVGEFAVSSFLPMALFSLLLIVNKSK